MWTWHKMPILHRQETTFKITFDLQSGSPPSSIKSIRVTKFPCFAATWTGVWPSSVLIFGPAPDFRSIRAHRSPSFTRAAICSGVSRSFPPGLHNLDKSQFLHLCILIRLWTMCIQIQWCYHPFSRHQFVFQQASIHSQQSLTVMAFIYFFFFLINIKTCDRTIAILHSKTGKYKCLKFVPIELMLR